MTSGARYRWCFLLGAALLATFASHQALGLLRERPGGAAEVPRGALGPGEVAVSSLLGGGRALAINFLWVRLLTRLQEARFEDLPPVLAALEVLQGDSPLLYRYLSDILAFDIPLKLPHRPEARWSWIRRGVETLERGRSRFPGSLQLLWQAETLYYLRFHPRRNPEDRRRFLEEPPRPGGPQVYGRDPLELAREAGEEALRHPGHPFTVDIALWAILAETRGEAVEGRPALLRRAEALLSHARGGHGSDPDLERLLGHWQNDLEKWRISDGDG